MHNMYFERDTEREREKDREGEREREGEKEKDRKRKREIISNTDIYRKGKRLRGKGQNSKTQY